MSRYKPQYNIPIGAIVTCTYSGLEGMKFYVVSTVLPSGYVLEAMNEEDGEKVLQCVGAVKKKRERGIVTFECSSEFLTHIVPAGPIGI